LRLGAGSRGPESAALMDVLAALTRMHRQRVWHWRPESDPFEVAVGAILVQNTSWYNAERALANLRGTAALEPSAMGALEGGRLAELVRPSGQYRQKTRKLQELLRAAAAAGGVPQLLSLPAEDLRSRLLGVWGIGPETADAILLYAARRPSFVVDAYTRRLFTRLRLGPGAGATYQEWKDYFEGALAPGNADARQALWARYHGLVVLHCKHLCLKRAPRCTGCTLRVSCPGRGTDG